MKVFKEEQFTKKGTEVKYGKRTFFCYIGKDNTFKCADQNDIYTYQSSNLVELVAYLNSHTDEEQ